MDKPPYQPVDCGFYDYFEIYAMRKTRVTIRYRDFSGQIQEWEKALILDTQTRNGEEYLIFENGKELRADQILQIGPFPNPRWTDGE